MKLSFALFALAFGNEDTNDNLPEDQWITSGAVAGTSVAADPNNRIRSGSDDPRQVRRYVDLIAMASKKWAKAGLRGKNKFSEKKYWTYGCHCFLLGDRPLSEMGKGVPVDALDTKCKAYKDCNKCIRQKHGEECIGEFKQYTWKFASKIQQFVSKNAAGSCERELFECDLQFVHDTFDNKDVFSNDHHAFWGGFDNKDDQNCVSRGTNPVDHECCGGNDRRYIWMGKNNNQCCPNGDVKKLNESC